MEKEYKVSAEVTEEPPSYAATSASTPLGFEQLISLNRFDVRQKDVTTEHGEVIFNLRRELTAQGCSYKLRFDLCDRIEQPVISIVPVQSCCRPRLEFFVNGELGSTFRQSCIFVPANVITDDKNKKVLKLKFPKMFQNTDITFGVLDRNGELVGSFTKKPTRMVDQLFTDANEFMVSFTKELDVRYKAAVIGICVAFIQDANYQHMGMGSD